MMRICVIVGTRPEIIKMSPIIRECKSRDLDYLLVHTNQHYSYNMDKIFFEELHLPEPNYNLEIGSGTHGKQTGLMLIELEKILMDESPDIVLVEGDTNTVLAGALASAKCDIDLGHVEAGLRSFDRKMPEEINRVLTDHLSKYLFAPTEISKDNLKSEGISENLIHVVGNTIVDATIKHMKIAQGKSKILEQMKLENKKYFLLTLHRQENVDDMKTLKKIIETLEAITKRYDLTLVYPIHPRTDKMLRQFGLRKNLENLPNINIIKPVGYLDFLVLEKNSRLILTDSGGVQEEACILNIPCVTLRYNTERPETVKAGKNIVAGIDSKDVLRSTEDMMGRILSQENPFGDGRAGQKILNIISEQVG